MQVLLKSSLPWFEMHFACCKMFTFHRFYQCDTSTTTQEKKERRRLRLQRQSLSLVSLGGIPTYCWLSRTSQAKCDTDASYTCFETADKAEALYRRYDKMEQELRDRWTTLHAGWISKRTE
jgi:hypothetical protein